MYKVNSFITNQEHWILDYDEMHRGFELINEN